MEVYQLTGRSGDVGGHYRKLQSYETPSDFELVGVSHYYGISMLIVVSMAHSEKREVRESLGRLVADMPVGSISDALAALRTQNDPRKMLRIERRTWQNAMRLISDILLWIQGVEDKGFEEEGLGLT